MSIRTSKHKELTKTSQGIDLPDWIFDVDSEDEDDGQSSLLQELEVDIGHIYRCILWMTIGPFYRLFGSTSKRHPLYISNTNAGHQNIDFWGPCSVVSLYGIILWLGRVKGVSWIYVIWSVAALFNHLVSRVWYAHSSLLIHVALLGYSMTSVLPFAAVILLLKPPVWLATIFEIVSVSWASTAAIISYLTIFSLAVENKSRVQLLFPTVVLMEIYMLSLIPIRH